MIPSGTRVQSLPAGGGLPQTFETADAFLAKAAWNESTRSHPSRRTWLPTSRRSTSPGRPPVSARATSSSCAARPDRRGRRHTPAAPCPPRGPRGRPGPHAGRAGGGRRAGETPTEADIRAGQDRLPGDRADRRKGRADHRRQCVERAEHEHAPAGQRLGAGRSCRGYFAAEAGPAARPRPGRPGRVRLPDPGGDLRPQRPQSRAAPGRRQDRLSERGTTPRPVPTSRRPRRA